MENDISTLLNPSGQLQSKGFSNVMAFHNQPFIHISKTMSPGSIIRPMALGSTKNPERKSS
jgi:hypothetical protein